MPAQPALRPEYDMHFDEAEANLVLQGLGELPAKMGFNLINRVAQIIATTNAAWGKQQEAAANPSAAAQGLIAGLRESGHIAGGIPAQDNP